MNKLYSALGAVAVIAIAVVFILQFQAASPAVQRQGPEGPNCAVEVHGSCAVSASEFWASFSLLASNVDPGRLRAMGFRRRVANGLLERWLLNQDAKRLGLTVGEDDLTAELAAGRAHVSLPAADMEQLGFALTQGQSRPDELIRPFPVKNAKTKKFDKKIYEKEVRRRTKLSPEDFRKYQKEEVIAARMRSLIRSRVRVGEDEARELFERERSTATVDYTRFDRRFYADLVVDRSQKAVDAWAEAHKEEVDKVWEGRKAQILPECRSVSEILVRLEEAATDEEKGKAQAKIERARDRLAKGEEFADVARAMSDGATAIRGGDIGCLLRGKAPKPLEDAVQALASGKVSDIVATDTGFFLVKLDELATGDAAEKLGRAQTAREVYVAEEAERLAVEASKNVLAAVKGGKSLKDAVAMHLSEVAKAKEADKKDKKADDKKKKAEEKKGDEGDRAPYTLDSHPYHPTVDATQPFSVNGDPISGVRQPSELTRMAFNLEKPGEVGPDTVAFDSGYIAIQLKEKTPATQEQWDKDRENLMASMRAYKASDVLTAYVKKLQTTLASDAKYTASLVEEPKAQADGEPGPAPMDDE